MLSEEYFIWISPLPAGSGVLGSLSVFSGVSSLFRKDAGPGDYWSGVVIAE